jgi:hypothetical protein
MQFLSVTDAHDATNFFWFQSSEHCTNRGVMVVLLDYGPQSVGEKTTSLNLNSARGFHVVDTIKAELEHV